jgi:predicted metal-dependent phosphoesterase TrpH
MEFHRTPSFDFHIHSKYSYDGVMEPKDILRLAQRRGLDSISITDHGTILGSLRAKEHCHGSCVDVRVGSEIKTDAGDIIGIDLTEEVRSVNWEEVIEEIHDQGGLSILAHPFRGSRFTQEVAKKCDLIEVFNCRSGKSQNARAYELASSLSKPMLAGSDAHVWSEVGRASNRCKEVLCEGNVYEAIPVKRIEKAFSYMVGDIKQRHFGNIPYHLSIVIWGRNNAI